MFWDTISSKLYLSSILSLYRSSFIRLCLLLLYNIRCVWDKISKSYLNSILSVLHYKAVSSTQLLYKMYWDTISSKLYLSSTSSHRLQDCVFYSFASLDVLRYYIIFISELNFEPSFIRLCLWLFYIIRCSCNVIPS